MRILVLEDNQERVEVFREKLEKDGVTLMFTSEVPPCIKALEKTSWDVLFLDHDLGGEIYVESDGEDPTGWHVAKWLSEHPDRKPETIILHSLNESGRKNMLSLLPEAKDVPFAWMLVGISDDEIRQTGQIGEIS